MLILLVNIFRIKYIVIYLLLRLLFIYNTIMIVITQLYNNFFITGFRLTMGSLRALMYEANTL